MICLVFRLELRDYDSELLCQSTGADTHSILWPLDNFDLASTCIWYHTYQTISCSVSYIDALWNSVILLF